MNTDAPRSIFAVVGLAGTGKSSVVGILKEILDAPVVYFGGVVVAEVRRRGLEVTEATERTVREGLRAEHGMSAIAQLASEDIDQHFTSYREIIIDGLYSYAECELLNERFPGLVSLIAVHATKAIREERLAQRPVRPLSAAELHSRDMREIRTLDKGTAIALADHHILNNTGITELQDQVKAVVAAVRQSRGERARAADVR
ncbi:AAA family ATPase [Actinosynnema sp. NPDC023658]|uniref:AAA family ATPase n=1 Tax=Actinosynnema sp. NPDC023658 TaxID=3155465 RepID=UPI0034019B58